MKQWLRNGQPALIAAPMEGVTDFPMRRFLSEQMPVTHLVTEFLRVSSSVPGPRLFKRHMPEIAMGSKTATQVPVVLQLLGGHPDRLAATAASAVRHGANAIDLNFGCPAPTVNRNDGGATLLKYPERLYQIVKAVRSAVPQEVPVSAKIRLGFDSIEDVHQNSEQVFKGGASWLTIHARTKSQGYKPPVFWQKIGLIKKAAPIPVVANGDIWSLDDFRRCRDITGCEHFMLGRGLLANPWLADQVARELSLPHRARTGASPDFDAWMGYIERLHDIVSDDPHEQRYFMFRLKQWLSLRNRQFPTPFFDQMKRISSVEALRDLMKVARGRPELGFDLDTTTKGL